MSVNNRDITLYAIYKKTINVTYNYYNGLSSSDSQVVYNNTSAFMFTPVDSATPSGYTFRGWSPSSDAEGALLEFTEDGKLELSGTTNDLYASYAYNVDVTFDANGGTGTAPSAMSGQAYMNYQGTKIGYQVTLPENTFTRDGYVFDGWYDAATDGTKVGDSAQSYKVLEAGTVLYAGWAEANYGITSDSSCGNYSEYSLTLKDAFDTASSGDIVCPLKAVTDASAPTLASGKTLTLDLNGYKITKTTSKITNKGTLTITGSDSNGSLSTSTMGTLVTNNGTLNLGTSSTSTFNIVNSDTTPNNGHTIVNNSSATLNVKGITNFAVYDRGISNYGTLNISGGTLVLYDNANDTNNVASNVLSLHGGSTTTISGGTITGKENIVIETFADEDLLSTLNITGGTVTAESGATNAIRLKTGHKLIMTGGTIKSSSSDATIYGYTDDQPIAISGGTIWNTSSGSALYTGSACSSTVTVTGGTIYSKSGNGFSHNGTGYLYLNGGYFETVSGYGLLLTSGGVESNYANSSSGLSAKAWNNGATFASVNSNAVRINGLSSGKHSYFGYNVSGYKNGSYAPRLYTGKASTYGIYTLSDIDNSYSVMYSGRIYYITADYPFSGTSIEATWSSNTTAGTFSEGAGSLDSAFVINYNRSKQ